VFAAHGAQCTCPHCGVDDDIIGLASTTWGLPVGKTLEVFAERGYAPPEMFADLDGYSRSRAGYDLMGALFDVARGHVLKATYPSMRYMLEKLGGYYVEGADRARLGAVCGMLSAADAAPFGMPWYSDFKKFVKTGVALVFPMYAKRRALSAIFAINKDGGEEVFAYDEADPVHFLGLRAVPPSGGDAAILVTSLRETAELHVKSAIAALSCTPLIAVHRAVENAEPVALTGLGVANVTVWSNNLVEAYEWAAAQPTANIAMELRGIPTEPSTLGRYISNVAAGAESIFRAVALRLADMPQIEAAHTFRALALDVAESNCLLAAAPAAVKPFITALVLGETTVPRGSYNGREIRATDRGWDFADDASKLSNFTLSLQETWNSEDRGTMVRGVVVAGGKIIGFEDELALVQNKTILWLSGLLSKNHAPIPYVYAAKYRRAIFDIAVSFGMPQPRISGDAVRWDGDTLILPGFSITPAGFTPRVDEERNSSASCTVLKPPATLDPRLLYDTPCAAVLWTLLVHIAVNVTEPLHKHRSPGIVVAGTHHEAWIRALREQLGLPVRSTAFVNGTCSLETEAVFPPIVNVVSEHSYRAWIEDPRHNAILAAPRVGLRVLRYLGWNFVDTSVAAPSAAAISAIPQVLNLIRAAIARGAPAFNQRGETPYYAMARAAVDVFSKPQSAEIMRAAAMLGSNFRYSKIVDRECARIVGSMYDLVRVGDLAAVKEEDDTVTMRWAAYVAAMELNGLKAPEQAKAMSTLRSGKACRLNQPPDRVAITAEAWFAASRWSEATP